MYDLNPIVSLSVRSQQREVRVAGERRVDGGNAWHMDVRGEVKVHGVPHRQGRGAIGHVSAGCKFPVVPLVRWSSHPTGVVTDGVEEGYAAGVPILGKPGRHVPQEEGGRVSLLSGCVDLLQYAGLSLGGGCVHQFNPIRV